MSSQAACSHVGQSRGPAVRHWLAGEHFENWGVGGEGGLES